MLSRLLAGVLGLVLALLAPAALAQPTYTVEGRVLDDETGETLVGVHVRAEGTTLGATTDRDGRFSLTAARPFSVLTFSFIGYQTQTLAVEGGAPLVVRMTAAVSDLQPVIVSGSRVEQARADAPVAVAALSAAELEAAKPDLMAEALNRVPGVHMVDLGNEQHAMSIRQPFSLKPLFLYLEDGIPIRPAGLFNHNALAEVNLAGVERVEVVRGPGSALYGAGAVGGAVNVLTVRPSREPAAAASVRGGGYGYGRADVQASATTGRLGVALGGYGTRQRDGLREHSDYDKRSATLRADLALAPGTRLTGTLAYNYLDTDTDGSLDSLHFFGQGTSSLQTFTYRRVSALRGALRLDRTWDARQRTQAAVFVRDNAVGQLPHYRLRAVAGSDTDYVGEINEDAFRSVGLHAVHEVYLGARGAKVVAGGTVDYSPGTYRAEHIAVIRDAATGRFTGYTPSDSLLTDYDVRLLNTAAFAQVEVEPLGRLKLVGALRYDRLAYDFDNHLPPGSFSGAPDGTNAFGRFSPRLGLVYAFTEARGLYANASRGFQPPEVTELYRGVQVPALRPATFDSYEVGGFGAFVGGRVHLDASLYRMGGFDEIVAVTTEEGDRANRNAGETRHLGVEYAVTLRPSADWALRFGGTNARHTYVRFTVDERAGRRLVYDGNTMEAAPAFIANGEVACTPGFLPGARVAVEAQRVSGYFMDPDNTVRYDGYLLLNVRAGYERGPVEVWATLHNATDVHYATSASVSFGRKQYTPGLPRHVTLGLGYRLVR